MHPITISEGRAFMKTWKVQFNEVAQAMKANTCSNPSPATRELCGLVQTTQPYFNRGMSTNASQNEYKD